MPHSRWAVWRDRALRLWLAGAASAVGAVGSLFRNKWLALHLAPAGFGVIGQVNAGQVWLGTLAGLGLGLPLARAIGAAVARGDAAAVRRATATAITAVAASATLLAVGGLVAARPLAIALLGSPEHAALVRISMLGVAGLALQGTVFGLFAGHSDVRAPLTYALVGNAVTVGAVLFAVPRFGLVGAVWSLVLFWPAALAGSLLVHRRRYGAALAREGGGFDRATGALMLKVAAAALGLALLDQGTLLVLRGHYVRASGLAANGLFQSSLALSQQVGAAFYAYLSGYAFGRISGAVGVAGIREYTRRQFAPIVALAALVFAAAMLASGPLLHLLYSRRFDPARPYLGWMMLGEFGRIGLQVWGLGALPLGGVRLWTSLGLTYVVLMGAGYVAARALGAGALSLPYAYAGGGLGALVIAGVIMTRRGIGLGSRDLAVLAGGTLVLGALAFTLAR